MISKKIHIVSCPRSKSTCIARVLEKALNYQVVHEPYIPVHDKVNYAELTKDWFKTGSFTTPTDVKNLINDIVRSGNGVIMKDISFALTDYVADIADADAKYIFLFRDPLSIAVSFLNKCDHGVGSEELIKLIGLNTTIGLYEKLSQTVPDSNILVVNTEDILLALKKIFKFIGSEFVDDYLILNKNGEPTNDIATISDRWHESKRDDLFEHWHGQAITSRFITTDIKYYTIDDFNYSVYGEYYKMFAEQLENDYNKLIVIADSI